ncbi:hypothetical protein DB30_02764 [Enhygromyxa salina]|uniref:Uncharacterized protein n=1 Tax=Enhygromyxa salina TaxID=215803 RepID=A0A0C2A7H1_9BACT|nr:hypothetical protein [Enhygromyxa salina]KIG19483.1 hypothetical protein DB30_02764 [Enhygromyxa salina]
MATKVSFEGKRELRWLMVGRCLITYLEEEVEFSDELWNEWMEVIGRPGVEAVMLCSWGATQPSHQQWRRVTRLMRELDLPVAVVTADRHNLALAKAASWLGTNIESHRWTELGAAVRAVGLGEQAISAQARIIALRDRFGARTSAAEVFAGTEAPAANGMPFTASSELVYEHSEDIQTRLAQVQARLQAHQVHTNAPD